jgi:hypothetical protein
VLGQHLHELERCFKQSLDSRHLSMSSGAAGAAAAGGAGPGGPGGARGLVLPTPGAAGSWQVCCVLVLTIGLLSMLLMRGVCWDLLGCGLCCNICLAVLGQRGCAGFAAAGGAEPGGLVLPTPGAAGSWQVCIPGTSIAVVAGFVMFFML